MDVLIFIVFYIIIQASVRVDPAAFGPEIIKNFTLNKTEH